MSKKEIEILKAIKNIPTKYKNTRSAEDVIKAIEKVMNYNHYSHEDTYKVKLIINGLVKNGYIELIERTSIFKLTNKFKERS